MADSSSHQSKLGSSSIRDSDATSNHNYIATQEPLSSPVSQTSNVSSDEDLPQHPVSKKTPQTIAPLLTSNEASLRDTEDSDSILPSLAPRWFLGLAALSLLISATFDTTATKLVNRQKVPRCDGCEPVYFEAPMFQTFTGYIGEFFFFPIYYIDLWIARKLNKAPALDVPISQSDFKKPHCPVWIWIFPLLLDFVSTSCLNYSTMLTQASTVQLLRNSSILIAFVMSAFVLKNKIYIHQFIGVVVIFLGLILVSIYALLNPDTDTNYSNLQWVGILTALAGTVLSTMQWVVEEAIFRHYYASPLLGVGWMGIYGIFVGGIALTVCYFTGWEDVAGMFYQMGYGSKESGILIGFNIAYIFSLMINTGSGITITKLSSSLMRTIVNAGRTVSIWLIEIILQWATFDALNFCGLILITIAIVIYNYNYFTNKRDHWFGDHALRQPAACLPNQHEVTTRKEDQEDSIHDKKPSKKKQSLRKRAATFELESPEIITQEP